MHLALFSQVDLLGFFINGVVTVTHFFFGIFFFLLNQLWDDHIDFACKAQSCLQPGQR